MERVYLADSELLAEIRRKLGATDYSLDEMIALATGHTPSQTVYEFNGSNYNVEIPIPYNCNQVIVSGCGGGGAGSGCYVQSTTRAYVSCGGGGAGESIMGYILPVKPNSVLSVSVGRGGSTTRATDITTNYYHYKGLSGGDTTIGPLTLKGGKPGMTTVNYGEVGMGGQAFINGVWQNSGGNGGAAIDSNGAPFFVAPVNGRSSSNNVWGGTARPENQRRKNGIFYLNGGGGGASLFGRGGNGSYYASEEPDSVVQVSTPGYGGGGGGLVANNNTNWSSTSTKGGDGYFRVELILGE